MHLMLCFAHILLNYLNVPGIFTAKDISSSNLKTNLLRIATSLYSHFYQNQYQRFTFLPKSPFRVFIFARSVLKCQKVSLTTILTGFRICKVVNSQVNAKIKTLQWKGSYSKIKKRDILLTFCPLYVFYRLMTSRSTAAPGWILAPSSLHQTTPGLLFGICYREMAGK